MWEIRKWNIWSDNNKIVVSSSNEETSVAKLSFSDIWKLKRSKKSETNGQVKTQAKASNKCRFLVIFSHKKSIPLTTTAYAGNAYAGNYNKSNFFLLQNIKKLIFTCARHFTLDPVG